MIGQIKFVDTKVRVDGDIDAVVVNIPNTGFSGVVANDRYKHVINHNLKRDPIGCQIIMSNEICNVKVLDYDKNKIIIQFDVANANVNLRIW